MDQLIGAEAAAVSAPPPRTSKYWPLYAYLRRQTSNELVMSTASIEIVLKGLLPKSSSKPGWWLSEADDVGAGRGWRSAGYLAELERDGQTVRFRRTKHAGVL